MSHTGVKLGALAELQVGAQVGTIAVAAGTRSKALIAGTLGNILEWYDFSVFGFLVPSLSAAFFPKASHLAQLLLTFGVFGVGFMARPLGSVIIGFYGDKAGRRAALTVTVGLMGVSTLIIGLLPTYQSVGIWAPILLTLARLAQGFSAGGEWGGAAAFMVEYAPPGRRGFVGAWMQFSVVAGLLLGSAFSALLAWTLGHDALMAWGWRIPFICGIGVAGFAVYFSLRLPDTPQFAAIEKRKAVARNPLRDLFTTHLGALITQFGLTIFNTASFYITLIYMPAWLTSVVKMSQDQALLVSTIGLVVFVSITPLIGALSDKIGRKPVLIASCVGFILLCYPLFRLASDGGFAVVLAVQIVLVVLTASYAACTPATYAELFPTRIRYSGLSIGYNTAVMVFGGFAPFIATWLVFETGTSVAPTFYVIGCAIVTLCFVLRIRETAFSPLPE
jgi:MHS family proline/betaine transporter-like MFS transporter